ncbi:MAG: CoB--CoM heterodisulfide reductase subunit C [Methanosarcinales archaeon]|nr:CoB--CoM heterodisulfide reductase subunit C [Methanosarcinales archaeon]
MTIKPSQLLEDMGYSIQTCMQCGTCTGGCPSGTYTGMNTRRIVQSARRDKDVLNDDDLWMCTTCYACQERCPGGIRIVDAILALRTEAVHNGIMLPAHRKIAQAVISKGHAVPINDNAREQRKQLGLDELPANVHKFPDSLEQVKKLLESTGFVELISEEDSN